MANVDLNSVGGEQKNLSVISSATAEKSAFQKASQTQPIKIGVDNTLITGVSVNLDIVEEGAQKPVGGSVNTIVLTPEVIAGFVTISDRVLENVDVAAEIYKSTPTQLARSFDAKVISGELGNLDDVSSANLDEWRDLHTILSEVNASSFVMSSAFAARLQGWRDGSGREYVSQTGAFDSLLGVPVHVFRSSTPLAWVGDFEEQSRYGVAVPSTGLITHYDQATLEISGEMRNLAQHNEQAWRVEAYFAFGLNPSAFRKIELGEEAGL